VKQKIEFNLPANLRFSSITRSFAEEVFNFVGFSKEWCSRLKLVVDELFMNAVRYGSTEGKSTIHVVFLYDDNEVEFKIEDDGTGAKGISPEELKSIIAENANHSDVTKTSGRGLALITNLWTDKLDIGKSSYGGVSISFVKAIETTPPPAPPLIQAAISKHAEPVPAPEQAQVTEHPEGQSFTLKLSGEIDQLNIEKLALPVVEQIKTLPNGATLVLDFSAIEYINSTFIGHLASWYKDVQKKEGQIVLKNTNDQIKDVLDLVGLGRVLVLES
jgi:anti-anti-sigma factor